APRPPGPSIRVVAAPEAEPVDLLEAAGAPVAKRLAPAVVALTLLWILGIFPRRPPPRLRPAPLPEPAAAPVAKRLAPAVVARTLLWLLGIFLRRRRRR